jgi:Mn-dependent DtxR family transcriptional regulator
VCRAIKLLQEGDFLTMEEDKTLHLTPMGQQAAESVFTRHAVLNEALLAIDVTPETARRDACEIEHVISEETFTRVKAFLSRQRGGRDRAETPKEDEDGRDQNNAEDRGNVLRDVRGAHLQRDPQDAPLREEGLRLPPEG